MVSYLGMFCDCPLDPSKRCIISLRCRLTLSLYAPPPHRYSHPSVLTTRRTRAIGPCSPVHFSHDFSRNYHKSTLLSNSVPFLVLSSLSMASVQNRLKLISWVVLAGANSACAWIMQARQ